jgi:DNA ligase (NAD+)
MLNANELADLGEEYSETLLREFNTSYREGNPRISDLEYDRILKDCCELFPDNDYFQQQEVEPEPELVEGKTVPLPQRMLSTQKAYKISEIEKWMEDCIKVGNDIGIATKDIFFSATAKHDGYACFDDGAELYTRGDGYSGTKITRILERGLNVQERGLGAGEIVVNKQFFQNYLSDKFENTRNIIAGVIKEGELDDDIKLALENKAVSFVAFSTLRKYNIDSTENLSEVIEEIWNSVKSECLFDTDGIVLQVDDKYIRLAIGSTSHHWKWQCAYKKNEEYHNIKVLGLEWNTSKNGRIIPVVLLEPTKVSGVTVARSTGHHFGNVTKNGIGCGSVIRLTRSGDVIPYIESVISPAKNVMAPGTCPSCGSDTYIMGDDLRCSNTVDCPAQICGTLEFFFKTIGNCDGFGTRIIEILVSSSIKSVEQIYYMTQSDFSRVISGKTGDNLFKELEASRKRELADWRFLAAFSIPSIGKGGCEKLLQHYKLGTIFDLTVNDIIAIDGFAEKSAKVLVKSLFKIKPMFDRLVALGFNLTETTLLSEKVQLLNRIYGKTIVFTGTMQSRTRAEMETTAKAYGAKICSSVSAKTDFLVIGMNVGSAKMKAAEKHDVQLLEEDEYLKMIGDY